MALTPSSSPSVGSGARALRIGAGAGAVAGFGPPSTPKLDGAKVSRAGSRVRTEASVVAAAEGGGNATAAGSGAVPVPMRGDLAAGELAASFGAVAEPAAAFVAAGAIATGLGVAAGGVAGAAAGLLVPRIGGGGGPIDFGRPDCGAAWGDGAATGAWEASGALAGCGAGRGGGFGDSVKDDSARSGEYATAHAIALPEHYKEISDAA